MTGVTPGRKEMRNELTEMLGVHLANTYGLMLRLQNFHWNAEGPQFHSAHEVFERFYMELWKEVDVIAERIRALGAYAPGSFHEFLELSQITDRDRPRDIDAMYDELITCAIVVREHCAATQKVAGVAVDEVTVDMLTKQLEILERSVWMFRSSLTRASSPDLKAVPDKAEKSSEGFINWNEDTDSHTPNFN